MSEVVEPEKQQEVQFKPIKLNIYLNNELLLPINIYPHDNLLDLRQFLSEASQLFFITSYHFEYNNQVLNEFVEIGAQTDIQEEARIDIVIDPYDEKSSRYHFKKVQEFISNPYPYHNIFGKAIKAMREQQTEKPATVETEKPATGEPEKIEEKKVEDKSLQISEKTLTLKEATNISLTTFHEVSSVKDFAKKIKFVQYLIFSGFNPPPPHRKLKGDYFYLQLRTLEGHEHHITATTKGFFVNSSTNQAFNAMPKSSETFYNLLDLISSISAEFRANMETIVNLNIEDEFVELRPIGLYLSETKWLSTPKDDDPNHYEYNPIRAEASLLNLHGFDPNGIRDWNEELQICKELPKAEPIQRINRDKAILKTHTDFVEAATQGAKGIVDKFIQPLNQQDPENQQVFVYNHIFFSYVSHTPDSYTQEQGAEASPTTSMANADLRNLKILHRLDIPGLHLLNTAIIDYKGQRVLAQTIIPGILNSDHNECTEFGSIDDGKTIHSNPEFVELMKSIADYFSLEDEVECLDENGEKVVIPASSEIKGIRSSDKKKFVLDLMRLSPRDLNWTDDQGNYLCCVVRPELISHYITSKTFQQASEHVKKEMDKEQTEKKDDQTETKPEESSNKEFNYNEYVNRIQEYILKGENKPKIKFNPSLETRTKLAASPKLEEQRKNLQELANFITGQAIPTLLNELINGDIILPCDSKSLGELFHAHGVNVRYIGKVCQSLKKENFPFLQILLERIMLAKSMKHYTKEWLKKTLPMFHADLLAHLLNCVFAPERIIHELETEGLEAALNKRKQKKEAQVAKESEESQGDKKKKKKKNAAKKGNEITTFAPLLINFGSLNFDISKSAFFKLKPSEVWDGIKNICKKRYNYDLPTHIFEFQPFRYPLTKLATLRDVCISTGIVIKCRDYYLSESLNKQDDKKKADTSLDEGLTFGPEDILNILPIVKHLDPVCDNAKNQIDLSNKLLAENKIEESIDCLLNAISILLNIFGPIHKDVAFCYSKIANIYYKLGEMNQAITYHIQSVKTLEKLYGVDNPQTAHAYSSLALFYYSAKQTKEAFEYMFKSLYSFNLVGGEFHPDTAMIYTNLALMYQDIENQQLAINCLLEALERNVLMYGSQSFKVATCYQSLALAHFEINDFKKSVEYQEKSVEILKAIYNQDDKRVKDAQLILERIKISIAEKTNALNQREGPKKPIGKNRPLKTNKNAPEEPSVDNTNQLSAEDLEKQRERERLLQKLRIAKANAKYGFR